MPTITTDDGVEIYYKDWGSGQPIVFSHGWPLSADDWDAQLMFFVNSLFIIVGLSVMLLCPESPFYLFVLKRQEDRAIQTLQSIRGQGLSQLVDEICVLRQEQKNRQCNNLSFFQLLRSKVSFRSSLLVVCVLHAGQQLIGINAVSGLITQSLTFQESG